MSTEINQVRSELEGKLEPPVDVMLDPSLLVAATTRERLADSTLFEAQTQATLDRMPTQPRVGSLYVPASFRQLLETIEQVDVSTTAGWNFYRGQAEAATGSDIVDLLDAHDVGSFDGVKSVPLDWLAALDEAYRHDHLTTALEETRAFLADGGILLSRTPASLDALRDAGVVTIDLGRANLDSEVHDDLTDIGYGDPASICALGVSSATATVSGLVDDLLADRADLLLYRLGR